MRQALPPRVVLFSAAILFLSLLAVLFFRRDMLVGAAPEFKGVLTYHNDNMRTGRNTSESTLTLKNVNSKTFGKLFVISTDGRVDTQPLYVPNVSIPGNGTHNVLFVATENDTVYALAANTGAIVWSTHVGTPVPAHAPLVPCGDISPTVGITGTPVIDLARDEIFAVADEFNGSSSTHVLVGLNLYTGNTMLDSPVDPPGQGSAAILQRTGLNLSNGNVVFGYGGNDGDCSTYHGWIVSAPEGGGAPAYFDTTGTANGDKGAVWMGGAAPEVDPSGNIWAATGNGSSSSPYDGSDSVMELSPALSREQLYAPSTWSSDNAGDADLGSSSPSLLSNGTILQVGKSHTGYLLSQANLGGVGHELASAGMCGGDVDGGSAVVGTVVYTPCGSGIQAVQTPGLSVSWTAANGEHGPPIVAGGLVWSIGGSSLFANYLIVALLLRISDENSLDRRGGEIVAVKFKKP